MKKFLSSITGTLTLDEANLLIDDAKFNATAILVDLVTASLVPADVNSSSVLMPSNIKQELAIAQLKATLSNLSDVQVVQMVGLVHQNLAVVNLATWTVDLINDALNYDREAIVEDVNRLSQDMASNLAHLLGVEKLPTSKE